MCDEDVGCELSELDVNMVIGLTVFLPYLSDMFPQREELIIIPMNTACVSKKIARMGLCFCHHNLPSTAF